MHTTSERISKHVSALPEGTPVGAKELLHLGSVAAVHQALSRLARRGQLFRVGRGMYVRPLETKYGKRTPSVEKVVEGLAAARGETVARHGAVAANAFGLTEQVPVKIIYVTTGKSRQIQMGAQSIELRHVPAWQTVAGKAGEAVRALAWIGKRGAGQAIRVLKRKLPAGTIHELTETRSRLPTWMAAQVSKLVVA
jgi:hypothetical protein